MTEGNWICLFIGMALPGIAFALSYLNQSRKPKNRKVSQADYYNICADCANGQPLPERLVMTDLDFNVIPPTVTVEQS